jgi:ribosomal protein L29
MKKTKKENLKDLKPEELKKKLFVFEENLRVIRFNKTHGAKSKDVKETKNLKKDIARILTTLNQK